jgi:hypothetical protein
LQVTRLSLEIARKNSLSWYSIVAIVQRVR